MSTVLCMISVIALAGAGTGYALWSQALYFNGTVYTGELDWQFTGTLQLDPGPAHSPLDYHCNPGFTGSPPFWQGDKDAGWTNVTVTDPHTVTLTLNNVYPCYFNMVAIYMKATGTIPLRIQNVTFASAYGNVILDSSGDATIFNLDLSGDGNPDIEFWWREPWVFGYQLHPGDDLPETSFWIHIMQPAPQEATLSFTVTLTAVQWNEYMTPL
jgi:hypothetical protein